MVIELQIQTVELSVYGEMRLHMKNKTWKCACDNDIML